MSVQKRSNVKNDRWHFCKLWDFFNVCPFQIRRNLTSALRNPDVTQKRTSAHSTQTSLNVEPITPRRHLMSAIDAPTLIYVSPNAPMLIFKYLYAKRRNPTLFPRAAIASALIPRRRSPFWPPPSKFRKRFPPPNLLGFDCGLILGVLNQIFCVFIPICSVLRFVPLALCPHLASNVRRP